MTKQATSAIRYAIANLAMNCPEWGIKMDEHSELENLCTICVSTQDSREDGMMGAIEIHRLAAIAESYGCTWSVQTDAERYGLEFFIC